MPSKHRYSRSAENSMSKQRSKADPVTPSQSSAPRRISSRRRPSSARLDSLPETIVCSSADPWRAAKAPQQTGTASSNLARATYGARVSATWPMEVIERITIPKVAESALRRAILELVTSFSNRLTTSSICSSERKPSRRTASRRPSRAAANPVAP